MHDNYEVLFDPRITTDLAELPQNIRDKLIDTICSKLSSHPDKYGDRLRKDLIGYWKLAFSKYRVVYSIDGNKVKVHSVYIRKDNYKTITKRLGLD